MDPILYHHYRNMADGKAVMNDDGSMSTVRTIQIDVDGVPTLIPTVWDGKVLSDREAKKRAMASGVTWPTASSHAKLRAYDVELHRDMRPMTPKEAMHVLGIPDATYE